MNGKSTGVLGVMPHDFFFASREFDYWEVVGYFTPEELARRDSHFVTVVARLKTGIDVNSAQRDLSVIAARLAKEYPISNTNLGAVVVPLHQEFAGDTGAGLWFCSVFAALALVLACIGVYGVLAYSVEQRTREIGIRVAVGASPSEVTRMILAKGLKLGLLGLAAGVGLAVVLGRLLQSLLYGANALSPAVYAATSAALVLAAVAACIIPAQRAARVDPVVALRNE
jgi:ABC-type antimicrobial peptide transport system permease subunit